MRHELLLAGMLALMGAIAGGCNPHQQTLRASATALKGEEYDRTISLAGEVLQKKATAQEAAEALYLRGRAYEQRPVMSQGQLDANMQAARVSYVEALKRGPSKELGTYIHASLGKVAFFQDDFGVASQQLWLAYGDLRDTELKAASLYYLGKSQQRSGQFGAADQTFTTLIQRFERTDWAKKAASSRGVRAFYVQLGVYSSAKAAEPMVVAMQQRNIQAARSLDDKGRYLLKAGPFGSYAQAKHARQRLQDLFKDAFVTP